MLTQFLVRMIRWRWMVIIASVMLALLGLFAAIRTPLDALPDLSENQILVYTRWPDHDPAEIESKITRSLTAALQGVQGVQTIRGSSDPGFSLIHAIFRDDVSLVDAHRLVRERVSQLELSLPEGTKPEVAPAGIPTGQIFWYSLSGKDTDLAELRRWQDEVIVPRLQRVNGIAEVSSVGGMQIEFHINAVESRLTELQLSIDEFQSCLKKLPKEILRPRPLNPSSNDDLRSAISILEEVVLPLDHDKAIRLRDVAHVSAEPSLRYGAFEKDGSEMVAGIVHLRFGANPLTTTNEILATLEDIIDDLPDQLRLVTTYDRRPLILGSISTLVRALAEALAVTIVAVVFIMRHWRSSFVIALTAPVSVLGAFVGISILNTSGQSLQLNVMSLSGIVISIGVLVDSSIVMVDNITHQLRRKFGDQPVVGDTSSVIAHAAASVAGPCTIAIAIMLVSFLPVFALGGIDGKMVRPLAWTKSMTLLTLMLLTLTLVPAMASLLIRGRLRSEQSSRLVRSVSSVYRVCLEYLLNRPFPLIAMLLMIFMFASAALGQDWLLRAFTVVLIGCGWYGLRRNVYRWGFAFVVLGVALTLGATASPIRFALRLPLDEGMIMDMPITIPRMTMTQAVDDLKARNMILCRFPEVNMVTGKVGRADTAFDPAPVDMIETMVEFRPTELWPRRKLNVDQGKRHIERVAAKMMESGLIETTSISQSMMDEIANSGMRSFDAIGRETCWQLTQQFEKRLAQDLTLRLAEQVAAHWVRQKIIDRPLNSFEVRSIVSEYAIRDQLDLVQHPDSLTLRSFIRHISSSCAEMRRVDALSLEKSTTVRSQSIAHRAISVGTESRGTHFLDQLSRDAKPWIRAQWLDFVSGENQILRQRVGPVWTQIIVQELCSTQTIVDESFAKLWEHVLSIRFANLRSAVVHHAEGHVGMPSYSKLPIVEPYPPYQTLVESLSKEFNDRAWLWTHDPESLSGASGELDSAVQMPGWANVWTRPIQNRVDMLATGVNSEIGIKVMGDDLDRVISASEEIAKHVRDIAGAVNVLADPVRDKRYDIIEWNDREIERRSLNREHVQHKVELATRGQVIRSDFDAIDQDSLIPIRLFIDSRDLALDGLSQCYSIEHRDGPATIKSENGMFRNYVRLNIVGQDPSRWVRDASQQIEDYARRNGVSVEWTGQFEHAARTRRSLAWIVPTCCVLVALLLYIVFWDVTDACIMMLSLPGAVAGGIIFQWMLGYPYSLAVGIGTISCFGMAAATSMIMLVYLRQALDDAGGLSYLTRDQLKQAVIIGATQRLRPKLLTEVTMILGLAPMLWSTGVGADVIRPMAAPVLGGILVADEVIDLFVPLMFYWTRCWRLDRRSRIINAKRHAL